MLAQEQQKCKEERCWVAWTTTRPVRCETIRHRTIEGISWWPPLILRVPHGLMYMLFSDEQNAPPTFRECLVREITTLSNMRWRCIITMIGWLLYSCTWTRGVSKHDLFGFRISSNRLHTCKPYAAARLRANSRREHLPPCRLTARLSTEIEIFLFCFSIYIFQLKYLITESI